MTKPTKTQSGGISLTRGDSLPNEKAGAAHQAKLEKSMTKEELSLRKPLEPAHSVNSAAG